MKSLFISFEGIDGCGKTTQISLLKKYLSENNYQFFCNYEPGGDEVSEKIRKILLDPANENLLPKTEVLLFSASFIQNTINRLTPALKENKIVISDRFFDSSLAYQGARGLDVSQIKEIIKFACADFSPQITFLIDISVEESLSRKKTKDKMEMESLDFFREVRRRYLELAENEKDRFVLLNGKEDKLILHEKIVNILKKREFIL